MDFELDVLYLLSEKGITKSQAAEYLFNTGRYKSKNSINVRISNLVSKKYIPKGILAEDTGCSPGARTYHKGVYYEGYTDDLMHERKIKEGIRGVTESIEELPDRPATLIEGLQGASAKARLKSVAYHNIEFYITLRKKRKFLKLPEAITWTTPLKTNKQTRKRYAVGQYLHAGINPRDPVKFKLAEKKDGGWNLQIWLPVIFIKTEWIPILKTFFREETFKLVRALYEANWTGCRDVARSDFRQKTGAHYAFALPQIEGMASGELKITRNIWIDFSRGYPEIETNEEEALDTVEKIRSNMEALKTEDIHGLVEKVQQHDKQIDVLNEAISQLQDRVIKKPKERKVVTGDLGGMFQ